jgi:hypothetical protein
MFPEMGPAGSEPPPDVNTPADITGQRLPGLSDGVRPAGSALSMVPADPVQHVLDGAAAPEGSQDLGVAAGRQRRTAQDRINQLTGRYRAAQEENGALTEQIGRLAQIVEQQNLQIQNISRGVGNSPPQASLGIPGAVDALDSPSPVPVVNTPQSTGPLDVASIVSQAIASYDSKQRTAQAATDKLRNAHEQAFSAACEEFPELADGRTLARRTFNELFFNSPLRQLPDGPYQVALQVRGILADETRRAPSAPTTPVDVRKRQASVVVPQSSPTDAPVASQQQLSKQYTDLMTRVRNGDSSFETHRALRYVRAAMQRK